MIIHFMSFLNLTPYVADFDIAVENFSRFVAALSFQSNDFTITSTINCLTAVEDGWLAPLVTAISSWWRVYWSTVLKSDPSVVLRMEFVMWAPTIAMISAAISSLTPIAARRAVFCLSASPWALELVTIYGVTTQSVMLTAAASWIDCFLSLFFLIATLDFYSVRVFRLSLPSTTLPSVDSSNI